MTRVLHVFGTMNVGGAELRTLELMPAVRSEGVQFHFLTLSGQVGILDEEIRALGGEIHPLRLDRDFPVAYIRLLRSLRPDVLDSHVATFSGALVAGAWFARVPCRIAHFRSDGDGHPDTARRRTQRRAMTLLVRRFASDIVGVTPAALSSGYRPDWESDPRARVIVNGMPPFQPSADAADLRQLMGVPPGTTVILHVGRPSPEKNRPFTVDVLAAVRTNGVDAHLALVGGAGPDTLAIARRSKGHEVEAYVHDLGSSRKARELMSQADALLLTSVLEGLPGVVIEALSVGTPVVSSDLPGARFIELQLGGIELVELEAPAHKWALAVERAVKASEVTGSRERRMAEFDASIFAQSRAAQMHIDLYQGAR